MDSYIVQLFCIPVCNNYTLDISYKIIPLLSTFSATASDPVSFNWTVVPTAVLHSLDY